MSHESSPKGPTLWLLHGVAAHPATRVELDADDAWRLLFNALSADDARTRMVIIGDEHPAELLLPARAMMVGPDYLHDHE